MPEGRHFSAAWKVPPTTLHSAAAPGPSRQSPEPGALVKVSQQPVVPAARVSRQVPDVPSQTWPGPASGPAYTPMHWDSLATLRSAQKPDPAFAQQRTGGTTIGVALITFATKVSTLAPMLAAAPKVAHPPEVFSSSFVKVSLNLFLTFERQTESTASPAFVAFA